MYNLKKTKKKSFLFVQFVQKHFFEISLFYMFRGLKKRIKLKKTDFLKSLKIQDENGIWNQELGFKKKCFEYFSKILIF